MNSKLKLGLIGAALIALPAAPALAQEDVKERAAEIAEQANDVQAQAGALANEVANSENELRARDEDDRGEGDRNEAAASARDGDDDGFDWGLLGLLGLAGLLGLKRNDNTTHVDARRDHRP